MNENRSIFWPLTLIAAGALWLMISMNAIPAANLWALTHIWPYALIALGVGLILRSFWKPFGMIVSALVVFGAVAAVFYAPQLGWDNATQWQWTINDVASDGSVPGSEVIKKETREVKNFDQISVRFPAEVIIQQGDKESLSIETDDNLLPQLSTKVSSGTLVIENTERNRTRRVRPSDSVKIVITVTSLKEIEFSTAGTLTVNGLQADELSIDISGAAEAKLVELQVQQLDISLSGTGSITASGTVDEVEIHISGLGEFAGKDLASQNADIEISGAGSATLRVEKELAVVVSGAGSVNYYGNPSVTKQISGAGTVKQVGD